MIRILKSIITVIPWLLLVVILSWIIIEDKFFESDNTATKEIYSSAILSKVEQMGKLELIKYNFQEVTEIKKVPKYIDLKLFKYKPAPDSKAVLISTGTAVGCVDLSQVTIDAISEKNDTVYIQLPAPELCFFKIDLEKSRIYDLQIDYMNKEDKAKFMEELYSQAEIQIKNSALDMGILHQTKENASTLLVPLFELISGKKVVIVFDVLSEKVSLDFD